MVLMISDSVATCIDIQVNVATLLHYLLALNHNTKLVLLFCAFDRVPGAPKWHHNIFCYSAVYKVLDTNNIFYNSPQ